MSFTPLFRLCLRKFGIQSILVFLLSLVLPSLVTGQHSDGRSLLAHGRRLDAAISAFAQGAMDESIRLLEALVADSTASGLVRRNALCYLGACFTAKGTPESALWAFTELIKLEPCFTIDSRTFPPPVLKAFYDARRANALFFERECMDPGIQTMAIVDFKNRTYPANPDYDPLELLIMELLGPSLSVSDTSLKIIERDQIGWVLAEHEFQAQHDAQGAVRKGELLGVHVVLMGSFSVFSDGDLLLTSRLVKVETGEQLFSEKHRGPFNDLERHIEALSRKIADALHVKRIYKPKASVFNSVEAGLAFARGLIEMDKGKYLEAYELFDLALQYAPEFIEARRQQRRIAPFSQYASSITHSATK